jgi:hypothetical protein
MGSSVVSDALDAAIVIRNTSILYQVTFSERCPRSRESSSAHKQQARHSKEIIDHCALLTECFGAGRGNFIARGKHIGGDIALIQDLETKDRGARISIQRCTGSKSV